MKGYIQVFSTILLSVIGYIASMGVLYLLNLDHQIVYWDILLWSAMMTIIVNQHKIIEQLQ